MWETNGDNDTRRQTEKDLKDLDTAILTHNFISTLRDTAQRGAQPLTGTLCDWPNLFWLQDRDWPLLCGYLCIYNSDTPTHHCLPVYICASCSHFVYTARTSSSVKNQYATVCFEDWQIVSQVWSNEYIILVGEEHNRVKTFFMLVGEHDQVKILFLLAITRILFTSSRTGCFDHKICPSITI